MKAQLEGDYNSMAHGFSCHHVLHGCEKQANVQCYWMKIPSIFHTLVLNNTPSVSNYLSVFIKLFVPKFLICFDNQKELAKKFHQQKRMLLNH